MANHAGSPDFMALFDPWQVQQALLNLVLNACQAAPGKSTIRIVASVSGAGPGEDANSMLSVSVINAGPAIPPGALSRLFEPFFSTRHGGTGLGLSISRTIARAHGGDVELRTNIPGSVEFAFTIPCIPASRPGKPVTPETHSGPPPGP
jgi:signal transduction histidine kinase